MGTVLTYYKFKKSGAVGLPKPLIYCVHDEEIACGAIPLNVPIANELLKTQPKRRSFRLPGIVDSAIGKLPMECIVKDFDVLFNPEYRIDVLQLFVASCRKHPFSILWPGTYSDGKLTYAEAGCPDFKQFDLKNYDVTCIV